MVNGHIIPFTPIAVDFWKIRNSPRAKVFFLSHCHADHTEGLSSTWQKSIYCSEITAKLAKLKLKVTEKLLIPLELNRSHIINLDKYGTETMSVTLLDANHCPGATMFLFQGYFGNILYTGDFRFHVDMFKHMPQVLSDIDVLYLDNTYCSPSYTFPSRESCEEIILDLVKENSDADSIVIGVRSLGKEDLLVKIANFTHEWIGVSQTVYDTAEILELPNVFTMNMSECRIRTRPLHLLSSKKIKEWNQTEKTVVILPSALYHGLGSKPYSNVKNVHVVPYSDHSSYSELHEFVSRVKPKKIIPIVSKSARGPMGISLEGHSDMSCFSKYICCSKLHSFSIPDNVKLYMSDRSDTSSYAQCIKQQKSIRSNLMRKSSKKSIYAMGVVFMDSQNEHCDSQEVSEGCSPCSKKATPCKRKFGQISGNEVNERNNMTRNHLVDTHGMAATCSYDIELNEKKLKLYKSGYKCDKSNGKGKQLPVGETSQFSDVDKEEDVLLEPECQWESQGFDVVFAEIIQNGEQDVSTVTDFECLWESQGFEVAFTDSIRNVKQNKSPATDSEQDSFSAEYSEQDQFSVADSEQERLPSADNRKEQSVFSINDKQGKLPGEEGHVPFSDYVVDKLTDFTTEQKGSDFEQGLSQQSDGEQKQSSFTKADQEGCRLLSHAIGECDPLPHGNGKCDPLLRGNDECDPLPHGNVECDSLSHDQGTCDTLSNAKGEKQQVVIVPHIGSSNSSTVIPKDQVSVSNVTPISTPNILEERKDQGSTLKISLQEEYSDTLEAEISVIKIIPVSSLEKSSDPVEKSVCNIPDITDTSLYSLNDKHKPVNSGLVTEDACFRTSSNHSDSIDNNVIKKKQCTPVHYVTPVSKRLSRSERNAKLMKSFQEILDIRL